MHAYRDLGWRSDYPLGWSSVLHVAIKIMTAALIAGTDHRIFAALHSLRKAAIHATIAPLT